MPKFKIGKAREGNGYCFFNEQDEEICRPYTSVWPFYQGYALVQDNDRMFFINEDGEQTGPKFSYINTIGRIPLRDVPWGGAYSHYELGSKLIPYNGFIGGFAIIFNDGKQGVVNYKGESVVSCKYDEISLDGCYEHSFYIPVCNSGKWGYIDSQTGEEVTELVYDKATQWTELTDRTRLSKNGKFGIVNKHGIELTDFVFDNIKNFHDGVAVVRIGVNFGYLREDDCNLITDVNLMSAYPFSGGYGEVTTYGNFGFQTNLFVDIEGNMYERVPSI